MDNDTFRSLLDSEAALLRGAASTALEDRVPSCPDWTGRDLVQHVAEVYCDKTLAISEGAESESWPPPMPEADGILDLFDTTLRDLNAQFDSHSASDPAGSWYTPDQTVGFWIRRMAQETLIHRVDAELAAGKGLSPVDEAFAADGVDEFLDCMVGFGSVNWNKYLRPVLEAEDGLTLLIRYGSKERTLRVAPGGVELDKAGADECAATVSGDASAVDLWLWRRGDVDSVDVSGDVEAARRFYGIVANFAD
ncbi:maleylpyruvate isomerase family mycothiol-dependent enzyme [Salininema proteolyticum]|uniref:Maleylpyruvate isomerase family mycothiol-dependent enzyme n=1 Tax=Salininema proteolyticum TaxID=1607685 RepID=A0ABV8U6N6_9ACTN